MDWIDEINRLFEQETLVKRSVILIRWKIGCLLVENIPKHARKDIHRQYLRRVIEKTGRSDSMIRRCRQFAEIAPTEYDAENAIEQYESWHNICNYLLPHNGKARFRNRRPTAIEPELWAYVVERAKALEFRSAMQYVRMLVVADKQERISA